LGARRPERRALTLGLFDGAAECGDDEAHRGAQQEQRQHAPALGNRLHRPAGVRLHPQGHDGGGTYPVAVPPHSGRGHNLPPAAAAEQFPQAADEGPGRQRPEVPAPV
jgi:hypothetical protein